MFELLLCARGGKRIHIPNSGPGSEYIIRGDENVGYFGLVSHEELFNFDEVEAVAHVPLTGVLRDRTKTNMWYKFYYNGKVLYCPQRSIRQMSWRALYTAGFIYGTDDNGKFPTVGSETNQFRWLAKKAPGGRRYLKVRLPRGANIDPAPYPFDGPPNAAFQDSEVSKLLERMAGSTGIDQKWGNYGEPGGNLICMESRETYIEDGHLAAFGNDNAYQRSMRNKASGTEWAPMLELMPLDFNPFPTIPDNGPGGKALLEYNPATTSGYFGEVPATQMPTLVQIEAAGAKSVGGVANPNAASIGWSKFVRNGKVFYYPNAALRTGTDWNGTYAAGFVYGTNDNGKFPVAGAPVNQRRTFIYTDVDGQAWEFLVRLPRITTVDPYVHTDTVGVQFTNSEYGQAIHQVHKGSPLGWGQLTWVEGLGQETNGTYNVSCSMSTDTFNSSSNWPKDGAAGKKSWLPVLELIGKYTPPPIPPGQVQWDTPGTYVWTVPADVSSVSVLVVGAGEQGSFGVGHSGRGGAGGFTRYRNDIPVVPGDKYTIVVGSGGEAGSLLYGNEVLAQSNIVAQSSAFDIKASFNTAGSTPVSSTVLGYSGGSAGSVASGAGGSAIGGNAAKLTTAGVTPATGTGAFGVTYLNGNGFPTGFDGGNAGGGAGARNASGTTSNYSKRYGKGGDGLVRIMWGPDRAYPTTNVTDV